MVANLVQNALRFADALVRVESRTEDRGGDDWAAITVDDGAGISEADRPHVFERLYVARHRPRSQRRARVWA